MKTLTESLFGDNITNDPFENIIDRLNVKKYTHKTTEEALDALFNIGGKRYGFYSRGGKREAFLKAIRKNDWVMIARKNLDQEDNYTVVWPYERDTSYLTQYKMVCFGDCYWCVNYIDIGWAIDADSGSREVFERFRDMGYEECTLITDKKMKDVLKKRLKELRRLGRLDYEKS